MILVDTSAWIELLRGRRRTQFAIATRGDTIVTCLPVVQEVLQGFDDDEAYAVAAAGFRDIATLDDPLPRAIFDDAIALFRKARRAGVTIRSSVDCLIAACAIRHDAVVLHADRDFDHLARVSSLRVESLPGLETM